MTTLKVEQIDRLRYRILVNGWDIANAVTGFTVEANFDGMPHAHIELLIYERFDVDVADAVVTIPDRTHDALVALGWTPP